MNPYSNRGRRVLHLIFDPGSAGDHGSLTLQKFHLALRMVDASLPFMMYPLSASS
jgi:hypothetical protein